MACFLHATTSSVVIRWKFPFSHWFPVIGKRHGLLWYNLPFKITPDRASLMLYSDWLIKMLPATWYRITGVRVCCCRSRDMALRWLVKDSTGGDCHTRAGPSLVIGSIWPRHISTEFRNSSWVDLLSMWSSWLRGPHFTRQALFTVFLASQFPWISHITIYLTCKWAVMTKFLA
jgi:hypothetical protein